MSAELFPDERARSRQDQADVVASVVGRILSQNHPLSILWTESGSPRILPECMKGECTMRKSFIGWA